MPSTNSIGDHGESIFNTRITQDDLFKVYHMGEKAPYVDFLIEILDPATPYYFMVQVKSTTLGYKSTGELKAKVSAKKLAKLIVRKLPTYVAGVDVTNEKVFICPAFNPSIRYSTIPTTHALSLQNRVGSLATLNLLKQDVIQFWSNPAISNHKISYNSIL